MIAVILGVLFILSTTAMAEEMSSGTKHMPADPRFHFETFYDGLRDKGYVIYPGKLTVADSFRIGCIGQLHEAEMKGALAAVTATLGEMGVTQCGRARAA